MITWQRDPNVNRFFGNGSEYIVVEIGPQQWEVFYEQGRSSTSSAMVPIGEANNPDLAMMAAEGHKQRAVDEPFVFYSLPENWVDHASEGSREVMNAVAQLVEHASMPPEDLDADAIAQTLALYAAAAVKGWKVEALRFEKSDLTALVLHVGDDDFVLMAFPLQSLTLQEKMPEFAAQVAELRRRAAS